MATGGKLADLTSAAAVKAAIAEYQAVGRIAFLKAYGFGKSDRIYLVDNGIPYDSKPIAAAAYGHQHGRKKALHFDDFSGGKPVIRALTRLGFTVVDWTSPEIKLGEIYTRKQLREIFKITDATLDNGVFRPKGRNSIWLFVTREKTKDRTPYINRFDGDLLYWQGQTQGRTDNLVIEHELAGNELLVFYRESKRSFAGAGFRYEGQFRYLSRKGAAPTSFVLQRANALKDFDAPSEPFDPNKAEDEREAVWALVKRRQGQPIFRRDLIRAYEGRCAVTNCTVEALLEAAHIHPYRGPDTNRVSNGLLLRADIHTLFDLGMLTIDADFMINISNRLVGTEYEQLQGKQLQLPSMKEDHPSEKALNWHRKSSS